MKMKRFAPYLGLAAIFVLTLAVVVLANLTSLRPVPFPNAPTASSTLSVVPSSPSATVTQPTPQPQQEPIANTSTTSGTQVAPVPKKTMPKSTPTPAPVPVTAPIPVTTPPVSQPSVAEQNTALDLAASALRAALVNIICYVPAGSGLHSISGSGIFIDSKGIIITNAHIAQYFLLANRGASCTIRTGSPAANSYNAAPIYISPAWLRANATVLTQTAPSGTGEYDFALIAVSKSANTSALPNSFPSIPLATIPPNTGTPIVIASYGAQFLEYNQIQSDLFPTVVFGSIKDVFTFATNTIDVLALGGSAAAQEGSSGGGASDRSSKLVGIITTSTVTGTTATRSLSAITASYVRAEYASEMGSALDLLLAEPTATSISEFATKIPTLEAIITAHLP